MEKIEIEIPRNLHNKICENCSNPEEFIISSAHELLERIKNQSL